MRPVPLAPAAQGGWLGHACQEVLGTVQPLDPGVVVQASQEIVAAGPATDDAVRGQDRRRLVERVDERQQVVPGRVIGSRSSVAAATPAASCRASLKASAVS